MAERRHTKQRALRPEAPPRPRRGLAVRQVITPSPSPAPAVPPRPHGNLDTATAEQIAAIADEIWPVVRSRSFERRTGLRGVLARLADFPGETWQERWLASGLDAGTTPVRDLFAMSSHP